MNYLKILCFVVFILGISCTEKAEVADAIPISSDLLTVFEKSGGMETATYEDTISFYEMLAQQSSKISLDSIGETDSGKPLHLVIYNPVGSVKSFDELRKTYRFILINNGIHPGESDGIDASMMLYRDLSNGSIELPEHTVIATIPVYNIGGCLNRNSLTRTNQNGPKAYGFRGNAQNYDLNRDFIKTDTKNAKSFSKIYHLLQPDVFIDTHVSNGADYQYTLTHLFTQHNKLGGELGSFMNDSIMPMLEKDLKKKSWDITPYVNVFNRAPDNGFSQFFDPPRYSTGYTTLFNTLGLMVETHMLKPYKQRVEGTYDFLKSVIDMVELKGEKIRRLKQQNPWSAGDDYPLSWVLDSTKQTMLNFKGYEVSTTTSEITGKPRLKYDRSKPLLKQIPYKNYFKPEHTVKIPKAYIIPQGWFKIIERLQLNQVKLERLKRDTVMTVESYRIKDYATRRNPYEGHYFHYNTSVERRTINKQFKKGDYLIITNQPGIRFLMETLEPEATDSFFNWNFFDTILQQKEGFSPYVWEDKALELLQTNRHLKLEFDTKLSQDESFANNWYAQLDWLHKKSTFYESAHMQYPVYRLP